MDMRKHLGKIILIGIALAGGYLVLSKENTSGYTIPYITVARRDIADAGGATLEKAGNFAKTTLGAKTDDALRSVSEEVNNLVGDAVVSVKTQALNLLKGAVNNSVEGLAVDLGVNLNDSGSVSAGAQLNPIAFAIKSGSPAYFTIKNRESGAVVYEIIWKDGKIDKGQINKGESKVVSHSWDSAGEYMIKFRITSEKGSKEYEVSISII